MRIISFAWTTPALLARQKSVTRRDWKYDYAKTFKAGENLQAWNKNPRLKHYPRFMARKVGEIQLREDPYLEPLAEVPLADWVEEGFEYLQSHGYKIDGIAPIDLWNGWKISDESRWVNRFEIVSLEG